MVEEEGVSNYFDRLGTACLGVVRTKGFIVRSTMGVGGLLPKGYNIYQLKFDKCRTL